MSKTIALDIDKSIEKQARVDSRRSHRSPPQGLCLCASQIFAFLRQSQTLFFVCVFIDAVSYERSHIDKSKDRFLNQKIKEFLNKTIVKNVFLLKI